MLEAITVTHEDGRTKTVFPLPEVLARHAAAGFHPPQPDPPPATPESGDADAIVQAEQETTDAVEDLGLAMRSIEEAAQTVVVECDKQEESAG